MYSKNGKKVTVYPGFCNEAIKSISIPLVDGMLVHYRAVPSIKFPGTHGVAGGGGGSVHLGGERDCESYIISCRKQLMQ